MKNYIIMIINDLTQHILSYLKQRYDYWYDEFDELASLFLFAEVFLTLCGICGVIYMISSLIMLFFSHPFTYLSMLVVAFIIIRNLRKN